MLESMAKEVLYRFLGLPPRFACFFSGVNAQGHCTLIGVGSSLVPVEGSGGSGIIGPLGALESWRTRDVQLVLSLVACIPFIVIHSSSQYPIVYGRIRTCTYHLFVHHWGVVCADASASAALLCTCRGK
eukprot:Tbor_TRINITY_DN5474_c1_g4::TRINITY_DN5474_c1_g4_i1::g.24814::m.24814